MKLNLITLLSLLAPCLVFISLLGVTDLQAQTATSSDISRMTLPVAASSTSTEDIIQPSPVVRTPSVMPLRPQKALEKVRQERIINLAANISNRMDGAYRRLFDITRRLESRQSKLVEGGLDVGTVQPLLLTITTDLATIKTLLEKTDLLVLNATTAAAPYNAWQLVREHYQTTGLKLRDVQAQLRTVVTLFKNAPTVASTIATTTSPTR